MANQQSKNIQYSGLTTLPDDYQSVDGSLAFATNAVYEDNAVKIIPPALAKNLIVEKGDKVYVHSMATYTHYIVVHQSDDGVRMWFVSEEEIPAYQEWARSHEKDVFLREGSNNYGKTFYEVYGDKVKVVYDGRELITNYANYQYSVQVYDEKGDPIKDDEGNNVYEILTDNKYPRLAYLAEMIFWYDSNGTSTETLEGTFKDMAFVGNTMIASTSAHRYYLLWDTTDNYYKFLGYQIPKMDIQWGLSLTLAKSVYLDCGITLKKENTPATDNFTPYCSIYYYHDKIISDQYYVTDGDGNHVVTPLKANTVYRAYQYVMSDNKSHPTIQAQTTVYGTSLWYDVCQVPKKSKEYTYFTTGSNGATDIRLVVDRNNASGRVYIEEGVMNSDRELEFTTVNANLIENTSNNHTAVLGYINKFVNEQGKKNNRFIHPFFLRYAVKLYDGTYCHLSTPVLLYPNTGYAPFLKVVQQDGYTDAEAYAFAANLRMQLMSYIGSEWEDLILGVGVFVSEPIYPYDQGKGFEEGVNDYTYLFASASIDQIKGVNYGIGIYCGDVTTGGYITGASASSDSLTKIDEEESEDGYIPNDIVYPMVNQCGYGNINDNNGVNCVTTTQIAKKKQGEINDDILSTCNFYKIREIEFSEISGEIGYNSVVNASRYDLNLEDGTLNSLEARETLKEEEIEFADFSNVSLFVYNNRLHMSGGSRALPDVTSTVRQNGLCEDAGTEVSGANGSATAIVRIRTDEGTRNIYCRDKIKCLAPWFFYPDTRAFEYLELAQSDAQVTETDDNGNETKYTWISYELRTHDFLNGSYLLRDVADFCASCYLNADGSKNTDVLDLANTTDATIATYTENTKINNLNKIYVSEASNPFVFKNEMVCTAGSGQVLALSSAAKALSQGQFGQFPLYAFTDEGIWAMSVGSTGAYETVQPIARDVVPTDAVKAITQLDSAVVFVTNRGVMLIEGSNVVCMSDDIDGDFGQFDPRTLDGFYDIMKKHLGFSTDDTDNTIGKWASQAFFDFIRSCQMKYDYVHQRITMYSDDCDIAYVYSLKSKQWLMQLTALQDNVNSYPDAYALRNTDAVGGVACTELVNLSEYDLEAERRPMVFVTRPFKLDAPDTFKTVNDIMQRGYFRQDGKINHIIGVSLYGGPDLFNWSLIKNNVGHKIQNLHGSPYKYFRVLVVSQLDAKEGISGCSVWYEPKDTQRMR